MKKQIEQIFTDKIIRVASILSILVIIVLTIVTIYYFLKLPPFIPLYNQLPWGLERLSDKVGIFFPLGISAGIFLINVIVAGITYEKMPLVSRILSITSLLCILLSFIFIARTVQLVI